MTTPMETAVEWLAEQFYDIVELYPSEVEKVRIAIQQAQEMEKDIAQQYAAFAIECDRNELPVLEFDGWINL